MANVIETRILLALTDLLSPGLLKAQQNLSNLNKTASSTSTIFRGITGGRCYCGFDWYVYCRRSYR